MTVIDYSVVVVYLVLVAVIGLLVRSRIHGLEDYFAGGHNVPWWLAAVSHHISGYSAFAFVGYAGVAYTVGFNVWTLFALPCFLAMTAGAFIWAPRWSRLKVMTPVESLERRHSLSLAVLAVSRLEFPRDRISVGALVVGTLLVVGALAVPAVLFAGWQSEQE